MFSTIYRNCLTTELYQILSNASPDIAIVGWRTRLAVIKPLSCASKKEKVSYHIASNRQFQWTLGAVVWMALHDQHSHGPRPSSSAPSSSSSSVSSVQMHRSDNINNRLSMVILNLSPVQSNSNHPRVHWSWLLGSPEITDIFTRNHLFVNVIYNKWNHQRISIGNKKNDTIKWHFDDSYYYYFYYWNAS